MDVSKQDLINEGLKFLEDATCTFLKIEDCANSAAIVGMLKGLVVLGETIYESYVK